MEKETFKGVLSDFPEAFYDAFAYYLSGTFFLFFSIPILIRNNSTLHFFLNFFPLNLEFDNLLKGYTIIVLLTAGAYSIGVVLNTISHFAIKMPFERLKLIPEDKITNRDLCLTSLIYPKTTDGSVLLWKSLRKREGIVKFARNLGFDSFIALILSIVFHDVFFLIIFFISTPIFLFNYICRERWLSTRIYEANSLGTSTK